MSKGKIGIEPTESQSKRLTELSVAITDLCEKEIKTHNPRGDIGAEDIVIMLTALQSVMDSTFFALQSMPELLKDIQSDLPRAAVDGLADKKSQLN